MGDTYIFHRGQTGLPLLEAVSGDTSLVSAITAKMRLSIAPHTVVPVTVTPRTDPPVGWDLTLDAAVSSRLGLGVWQLDARLEIGGGVVITDPVSVNVVSSASGG